MIYLKYFGIILADAKDGIEIISKYAFRKDHSSFRFDFGLDFVSFKTTLRNKRLSLNCY